MFEFQIVINPCELAVLSPRLDSVTVFPFDRRSKSRTFHLDFLLIKEGLSIYSNHLRGTRFIQFTRTHPLSTKSIFKLIKADQEYSISLNTDNPTRYFLKLKMDSTGIIQTIEHGKLLPVKKTSVAKKNLKFSTMVSTALTFLDLMVDDKHKTELFKEKFKKEGGPEFEEFLDLLSMGTSFITNDQKELFETNQKAIQKGRTPTNDTLKEFMDIISAAATFIQFLIEPRIQSDESSPIHSPPRIEHDQPMIVEARDEPPHSPPRDEHSIPPSSPSTESDLSLPPADHDPPVSDEPTKMEQATEDEKNI